MANGDALPTVVLFLHDLFTVVWVGGMLTLALVVLPVLRTAVGPGPQVQRLAAAIHSRLKWFAYAAIAGLVVTGVLLSRNSDAFRGFFAWGDSYAVALSLKHAAVILMVAIALTRSVMLSRGRSSQGRSGAGPAAGSGPDAAEGPDAGDGPAASMRPQAGGPDGPGRALPRSARVSMALLAVNAALAVGVLALSAYTSVVS